MICDVLDGSSRVAVATIDDMKAACSSTKHRPRCPAGSSGRASFSSPIFRSRFTTEWIDTYLDWWKTVADGEGHRSYVLCDKESAVLRRLLEIAFSVAAHLDLSPSPRVGALPPPPSRLVALQCQNNPTIQTPSRRQPAHASPPTRLRLHRLPLDA
jgi:hypothetical protein